MVKGGKWCVFIYTIASYIGYLPTKVFPATPLAKMNMEAEHQLFGKAKKNNNKFPTFHRLGSLMKTGNHTSPSPRLFRKKESGSCVMRTAVFWLKGGGSKVTLGVPWNEEIEYLVMTWCSVGFHMQVLHECFKQIWWFVDAVWTVLMVQKYLGIPNLRST